MIDCSQYFMVGWMVISIVAANGKSQEIGSRSHMVSIEDDSVSKRKTSQSIASCMTTACHGASTTSDTPVWQRSGSIWFELDPHARAYTTLLTEESQNIIARLTKETMLITSPKYRETLVLNCIACHSNERASLEHQVLGADCQVCHGPAKAWGDEHYAPNWKSLGENRFRPGEKTDLTSTAAQSSVCSSCHIGQLNREDLDREVNHRMMAAGHPPMHFDFALFSKRYPKHWSGSNEKEKEASIQEFEVWRTGKLQTAIVRIQFLLDRANRALLRESNHDWPELSEFSCFRCHHSLEQPSWRQLRHSESDWKWDPWCSALLEFAVNDSHSDAVIDGLSRLQSALEESTHDRNAIQDISKRCGEMLALLEKDRELKPRTRDVTKAQFDQRYYRSKLVQLLNREDLLSEWESAAEWMIALRALSASSGVKLPELKSINPYDRFFAPPLVWSSQGSSKDHSAFRFDPKSLFEFRGSVSKIVSEQLENQP